MTPDSIAVSLPPADSRSGAFIADLARLVLEEAETARRQVQQVWTRPLRERVAAGRAIADVRIARVGPDGLITLTCPRNDSRFREGDLLCLNRTGPFYEPNILVTLEADEETELLVSAEDPGVSSSAAFDQPGGWVLDEGYLDLSGQLLAALGEAGDTAAGREQVLPLLTGRRKPLLDAARYERGLARGVAWGLNEQQREAVAAAYASDLAWLIQGPPGTGKTLVLARLAQLLVEDGERVLITAFTHRAINNALNTLASLDLRRELIMRVWQSYLADSAFSADGLQDEIDWVKDRTITTRQGYLSADRSGRGFGLTEAQRERVYAAMRAYQAELQRRGLADFGDVPRRIWRALLEEQTAFPRYDFLLVDEAQFFAPIWFEIIKLILTPAYGRLFLVADPTQGFLKRRQSWLASGLNVRGRTQRLERCYRTTRAILAFASRFYQLRLPGDDEATVATDLQLMSEGPPPQVVPLTSEQDELTRVTNEVRALANAGVPLDQMLVIHADGQGAARTLERLRREFSAAQVLHPRERAPEHQLRVCGLDAATGLESPIVFLMGVHRLCEAEGSLRLSEEERAEQVRDNTRRLYMAMTRAGQRLILTYVGQPPAALQ